MHLFPCLFKNFSLLTFIYALLCLFVLNAFLRWCPSVNAFPCLFLYIFLTFSALMYFYVCLFKLLNIVVHYFYWFNLYTFTFRKKSPYGNSSSTWEALWADEAGAQVSYILWGNSTEIGCVIGRCTEIISDENEESNITTNAMLVCLLSPSPEKNKAPFR